MKNLVAIVEGEAKGLEASAKVVNNGRVDDVYFYCNDKRVSVCHPHRQLSESTQKAELDWFLKGYTYTIINQS